MVTASTTADSYSSKRASSKSRKTESTWKLKAEALQQSMSWRLRFPVSIFTSTEKQRDAIRRLDSTKYLPLLRNVAMKGSLGDLDMAFTAISRITDATTMAAIVDRYHRGEQNYNLKDTARERLAALQRK